MEVLSSDIGSEITIYGSARVMVKLNFICISDDIPPQMKIWNTVIPKSELTAKMLKAFHKSQDNLIIFLAI